MLQYIVFSESFKIPMYWVCICVGILAAFFLYIKICQREKMDNQVINFYVNILLGATLLGFGSAILFQGIYNLIATGKFVPGLTFLGGLIGGVVSFFVLFLIFAKPKHKEVLFRMVCNILPCIILAHCFGRLGCFCAGCCYGKITEGPFGIAFPNEVPNYANRPNTAGVKRLPTQLFEAAFLLALFFVTLKFRKFSPILYPGAYGVWRLLIEYIRDDPRGNFVPGLTPSQFQSILLILLAAAVLAFYLIRYFQRKKRARSDSQES